MARSRSLFVLAGAVLVGLLVAGGFLLWPSSSDRPAVQSGGRTGGPPRPAGDELPSGPATAVLEGVVLDPHGAPVPGARLALARTPAALAPWTPGAGQPVASRSADPAGRFRFDGLHAGAFSVTAMARGLRPGSQPVMLAEGQRQQVELRLGERGLQLSGRVLDVTGGVVAGARVWALDANRWDAPARMRAFESVTSDQGEFQLYLGPGRYSLMARADGYAPAADGVYLARDTIRDLRLTPAARLSGRVIDGATRAPVEGAELSVTKRLGVSVPTRDARTDAEGSFSIGELELGTYRVTARQGRRVGTSDQITVGLAGNAAVEVVVHRQLVVAGRVTSAGRGLPDIRVGLSREPPPMERPMLVATDAEGRFRLEGVLPGVYRLYARPADHLGVHQQLTLLGDREDLQIEVSPAASLTGKVVSADGKPVADATVMLRIRPPPGSPVASSLEHRTTDADGTFRVEGLPGGQLQLTAQHADHGLASIADQAIAPQEKLSLTLTLKASGSISGKVTLDDGRPAAGARIEGRIFGRSVSGEWHDTAAADGGYELRNVAAGKITVLASNGTDWMMSSDEEDRPEQKTVPLAEGERRTGVDLVVAGARRISGLVVGPDGAPLNGAEVTAGRERAGGGASRGAAGRSRAFSGEDGRFSLDGLASGQYTLWAMQAGYSDAELLHVDAESTGVKLQLQPEASIAGVVVTAEGKPVTAYVITLARAPKVVGETPADRARRLDRAAWDQPTDSVSDPSGRFFFGRVDEGDHELQVKAPDGSMATASLSVSAGERKQGVRVVLERVGKIVGKVLDAESGQPLTGIEVRPFGGGVSFRRSPVFTDASGAFAIEGLRPGDPLNLVVMADRKGYLAERRTVELPRGGGDLDLGTFRLSRGSVDQRMQEGTWDGLTGITNSQDDKHTIVLTRPGTPAEKAGLGAGDVILAIDGKDVAGQSTAAIEYQLRGRPGTTVAVTVQKPGQPARTVNVTRYQLQRSRQAPGAAGRAPPPSQR